MHQAFSQRKTYNYIFVFVTCMFVACTQLFYSCVQIHGIKMRKYTLV
jgi:fatty acid desaturase